MRLAPGEVTEAWDGQPVVYRRFRGAGVELRVRQSDFSDWPETTGPHSVNFSHRWARDVRGYVAWFPRDAFLDRLDAASWRGYLASFDRRRKPQLEIDDDSHVNKNMLRVFDGRTRVLSLVRGAASPQDATERVLQVAVEHRGGVVVFGLEGPAESVESLLRPFEALVKSFEPAPAGG